MTRSYLRLSRPIQFTLKDYLAKALKRKSVYPYTFLPIFLYTYHEPDLVQLLGRANHRSNATPRPTPPTRTKTKPVNIIMRVRNVQSVQQGCFERSALSLSTRPSGAGAALGGGCSGDAAPLADPTSIFTGSDGGEAGGEDKSC